MWNGPESRHLLALLAATLRGGRWAWGWRSVERRRRRSGASTTSHAGIRELNRRPGRSRRTVMRREDSLSSIVGSGGEASVPHTALALPPDHADLHPPFSPPFRFRACPPIRPAERRRLDAAPPIGSHTVHGPWRQWSWAGPCRRHRNLSTTLRHLHREFTERRRASGPVERAVSLAAP